MTSETPQPATMPAEQSQPLTRAVWLKTALGKIKAGDELSLRCVMATDERLAANLCKGDIPADRVRRNQDTCGPECQADKRRIRREILRMRKCSSCGHGYTKKEREAIASKSK